MVLISCVVSTINEHELKSMVHVARDWGVDWLNIQFLNFLTPERSQMASEVVMENFGIAADPWSGFEIPELAKVDVEELSETIERIKRHAPCPVSVMRVGDDPESLRRFHYSDSIIKDRLCHMPFVTMFITPKKHPVFCIDYPYYLYGDLTKQSLVDAWTSETAQVFRQAMIKHYREHGDNFPQCRRCNWPFNT